MISEPAGIICTGCYLPDFRMSASVSSRAWGPSLGEHGQKSVPNHDEDATTMAIAAGQSALDAAGIARDQIDAVWIGTESKPYVVKSIAATVAAALGLSPWVNAADLEFACRGAMEALLGMAARVAAGHSRYGLVVGVDAAQGRPGDELERSAGAGAAAFVVGPVESSIAAMSQAVTYVTDTPDFFRRDGAEYPTHANRFTGQPAYFHHIGAAVRAYFEKTGTSPRDYRYAVFHQPNLKFPQQLSQALGFVAEQVDPVMLYPAIGNTYAANCFLGIIRALELADSGDRVLVGSYGSGAGADCFSVRVTGRNATRESSRLEDFLKQSVSVGDYGEYLRMTRQVGCRR